MIGLKLLHSEEKRKNRARDLGSFQSYAFTMGISAIPLIGRIVLAEQISLSEQSIGYSLINGQ